MRLFACQKNKKIFVSLISFFVIGVFFIGIKTVLAQPDLGFGYATILNLGTKDLRAIIVQIINIFLGFLGIIAVIIILYGGYLYMTSRGEADRVEKAKKVLINAVVGLGIIMSSYAIAFFVMKALIGATGGGGGSVGPPPPPPPPPAIFVCTDPDTAITKPYMCSFNPGTANIGDFVTIKGGEFGTYVGGTSKVELIDTSSSTLYTATIADCGGSPAWWNDKIVIEVPSGMVPTPPFYDWIITDGSGVVFTGSTDDWGISFPSKTLSVSAGSPSPGIACIVQDSEVENTEVIVYGKRLSSVPDNNTDMINFTLPSGSVLNPLTGTNPVTNWSATAIRLDVPFDTLSGDVQVTTIDPAGSSNLVSFKVLCTTGVCGSSSGGCCSDNNDSDGTDECVDTAWCGGSVGDPCDDTVACGSGVESCLPGLYCDDVSGCTCQSGLPRIDWVMPGDGAVGNWVSIGGADFGTTAGAVYFCGTASCAANGSGTNGTVVGVAGTDWILAAVPTCATLWTDNLVITEVPTNAINGPIKIVKSSGVTFFDTTNNLFGFPVADFDVNTTARPGLCDIAPTSGFLGSNFDITGKKFNQTGDLLTNIYFGGNTSFPAANFNLTDDSNADADVPNVAEGSVLVYASTVTEKSNPVIYTVTLEVDGTPKIELFSPDTGPAGTYVTIYGTDFGTWDGGINSSVQFDQFGVYVNGDFDFPDACENDFWTNNQIIVKVPTGATTGQIIVTNRDSLIDDTSDLTPSDFTVGGTAKPGICNVTPKSGPLGTSVNIDGEDFTGASAVTFFNNKNAPSWTIASDERINSVVVPGLASGATDDDAVSGDMSVTGFTGEKSNGYAFQVFDCRDSAGDCSGVGLGLDCCYTGACMPSGGCNNPTKATYSWDFSTGVYTTCSGYSLDQCTTATSCPNSPGQCSPDLGETVDTGIDCGDIYGASYCNSFAQCQYGSNCSYIPANSNCELTGSACDTSSTTILAGKNSVCSEYSWSTYPRVAEWHFDEGTDSTAFDDSGNSNDGLIYGATWSGGRHNGGLIFNGISDCVLFPDSTSLNVNNNITLEAWINKTTLGSAGIIVGKHFTHNNRAYMLGVTSTGTISFELVDPDNTPYSLYSSSSIVAGNWYHIVATYDKVSGLASIFINGVLDNSVSFGGIDIQLSNIQASVGCYLNNLSGTLLRDFFDGQIDEVSIYDRALTGPEALARYISGTKDYVWQYPVGGGCIPGSFQDTNGKCTVGSVSSPTLCGVCQDGFGCSGGACTIGDVSCPAGAYCVPDIDSDTYKDCVEDIPGECECCCRVGFSETDCCAGLTCENSDCGGLDVDFDDDGVYDAGDGDIFYGSCTGCAVWDSGFFQTLSDQKCGCKGDTRVCVVDELNPPQDSGFCGDCNAINSITYDSDGSGGFVDPTDIIDECGNHSACCWDGSVGGDGCYTCDSLRVVENVCKEGLINGLVGHWELDESPAISGVTINDSSLSSANGVLNSKTIDLNNKSVGGKNGLAISFDGIDDYISIPDNDIFNFSNTTGPGTGTADSEFSFSYWIYLNDLSQEQIFLSKYGGRGYEQYYNSYIPATGDISFSIYDNIVDGSDSWPISIRTTSGLINLINTWYHVVGTYDATATSAGLSIFINGVKQPILVSQEHSLYVAMDDTSQELNIGGLNHSNGTINGSVNGKMDDVRIYNRVLSPQEIVSLYIGSSGLTAVSSPSPSNNTKGICINANIQAVFNKDLDPVALPFGVTVKKCNTELVFNPSGCSTVVVGAHSIIATGFDFNPTADFDANTWYQVVLDSDLKSEAPSNLRLSSDYVWQFRTSSTICQPDSVAVIPSIAVLDTVGATQDYSSFPMKGCDILDPASYTWSWGSSDTNVATLVTASTDNTETAKAEPKDGVVDITATTEGITGVSDLTVLLDKPEVIDYWPNCDEACLNASVGAEFNIPMLNSSLTTAGNIELYKWYCGNSYIDIGEDCDDGNTTRGDGCDANCLHEGSLFHTTLVGYWKMDDDTGTTIADVSSMSATSGTLTNFTNSSDDWVVGKYNKALRINGSPSNNYVYIQKNPADIRSVSMWFNPSNLNPISSGGYQSLFSCRNSATTNDINCGVNIYSDGLIFYIDDGVVFDNLNISYNLNNNEWYYLVANWGSLGKQVYINGELVGSNNYISIPDSVSTSMWLGPEWNLRSNVFDGAIDELRFYSLPLLKSQVLDIMNQRDITCGDGKIDNNEDCDGNPFPSGCGIYSCLNTGSAASALATCGNSTVELGEDCDDDITPATAGDGCSVDCLNEGTDEFVNVGIAVVPNSTNTMVDIVPSNYFDQDTYYRAVFHNTLTSVAGRPLSELNYDFDKDGTDDSFSWSFRSKDQFCSPDIVRVDPQNKTLYSLGTDQEYEATPYGAPDSCNASGQKLNGYAYNWTWDVSDGAVADVTNLDVFPSCGNGKIEKGEDCDDANTTNSDGCSSLCINEGTTQDSGLVLHWDLDEGSGVVLNDSSPSSNNGNLINGSWTTGRFGAALEFDGVDDYVSGTYAPAIIDNDPRSVSLWFNYDDISGDPVCLGGSGNENAFCIEIGTTITAIATTNVNTGIFSYNWTTGWHYIAVTYDSTDFVWYIDGNYVTTVASSAPLTTSGSQIWLGKRFDEANPFGGVVDDVRVYNTVLTGAQVLGNFNQKNYLCANGIVDPGEDCDGSPFPQGCDINTCLHEGSVAGLSVCGDGVITEGEDCDDGNTTDNDGCNNICLNEGTETDDPSLKDHYQSATSKSPGTTDIIATVNYCEDNPIKTCGTCDTGACVNSSGTSQLDVVCGFESDDACSKGICGDDNFCTNNSSVDCSSGGDADCNLSASTNKTCTAGVSHSCQVSVWGGTCSVSIDTDCYSDTDCPTDETCQSSSSCMYCKNNTSIECNLANGTGVNTDCNIGVGYDSCCYSRPNIEKSFPDPTYFDSLNATLDMDCNNATTSTDSTDDFCNAFGTSLTGTCTVATGVCDNGSAVFCSEDADCDLPPCQTYTCDASACSAYGKCQNSSDSSYPDPSMYCLTDDDCPQDDYNYCNKTCTDDSDCNDIVCGACKNAQISIIFNQLMDKDSFTSDGVCSDNQSKQCVQNSDCSGVCLTNIRMGVRYDNATVTQKNCPDGYFAEAGLVYQPPKNFIARTIEKVKTWINKLLGKHRTLAAEYWCAIPGSISSINANNKTTAIFSPQGLTDDLLSSGLVYRIKVKEGVRSIKGVVRDADFDYTFNAGDIKCEVNSVDVYVQ